MNGRERINNIFARRPGAGCGFWTGNPHDDTLKLYLPRLGFTNREQLFVHLQDDCRWLMADVAYRHPEGRWMFDPLGGQPRRSLSQPGCFAECESIAEVEAHPWPNPDYLDFSELAGQIRHQTAEGRAILSGMWSCFFHVVADYFGMENYFMKMYTHPAIVEAVTERVVDFYVEANRRFFAAAGDTVDTFFFGNDFGTQRDLIIPPEAFDRFILPSIRRLIAVARQHGKRVMMHSCGSVHRIIPRLIDAGVDALHPLQAQAAGMDAASLARHFKGQIAFVGGVDTQRLLVHATPMQIRDEVRRLKDTLGPHLVISPSHECILPNVPLENVEAMAEVVRES